MNYAEKRKSEKSQLAADGEEIRRTLGILFEPGDVVEIRAFKSSRCTISGYYDDFDKLTKDAVRVNQIAGTVYVTLNRIKPALLARRANRYEEFASTTTNDDQVVRRRWLPIDLDADRPAGISSSDDEHETSIQRARDVRAFLVHDLGWPEPIAADSGNGAHLLPRIDLPNDAESAELVRRCLEALDVRFSDDRVHIDTGNFNASRIWKFYGTVASKGDSTANRPHRLARLLHVPTTVGTVPIDKLKELAAMAPKPAAAEPCKGTCRTPQGSSGGLDVAEYLVQHGIEVLHDEPYRCSKGTGHRWVLGRCVWNPEHADKSAWIIQWDSGAIVAGCQHNSCQGKGWHDLRDAAEPGWRGRQSRPPTPSTVYETSRKPGKKAGFVDVDSLIPWKPFPVEVLPEPVQSYVQRVSAAIGCDPSYVAVPMLPALASAIGNTREIRLKRGWSEPAVLWGAIVGDSGTTKSPAADAATRPIKRRQARAIEEYRRSLEIYQEALEEYRLALDDWKKSGRKRGEPKPEEPEQPVCQRVYCSDVTVEALADRLHENPRGLLLARDELAGWIRSFDQYKGGRGADTAHWLTMHGARDLLVDRKTGDRKTIFVPRAAVSICGTIQPEILARSLGQEHIVDGLAARLLLTMPPRRRKRWSEADIDEQVEQRVDEVLGRLYRLEPDVDENGQPEPVSVMMTADGKTAWIRYYDEHAAEQVEATGERAAMLSKLEGAAARLALVVHFVRVAADDQTLVNPERVDEVSVMAGVTMARWFAYEAERVYMVLHETDQDKERRQIIELIGRKGGKITPRGLRQSMRRFKDSTDEAEQALDELVQAGIGTWEQSNPGGRGGRPTRVFSLSTPSTVYETPVNPEKSGGFVDVDTVDTTEINMMFAEVGDVENPDEVMEWVA